MSLFFKYILVFSAASLPGMWDRTITIGSAGKTFSVTGWKTGWCVGPPHLVHCAQIVHQNCTYNCPTPIQVSLADNENLCILYWKHLILHNRLNLHSKMKS